MHNWYQKLDTRSQAISMVGFGVFSVARHALVSSHDAFSPPHFL